MEQLNLEHMEEAAQPNLAQSKRLWVVLASLVEEDNDAILVELCERVEQRVGVRCLSSHDGTHCLKAEANQEKKLYTRRSETRNGCNS